MSSDTHQKVTASHLKRDAYLYVRQSTLRQVFENTGYGGQHGPGGDRARLGSFAAGT